MPQPHDGAFRDRPGALGVFGDQRPKHLPVPGLRMLHIQHGVHGEIMPFPCRYTEAAQSFIHISGPCRRSHLDDAEGSYRMKRVAMMLGQSDHGVAKRE